MLRTNLATRPFYNERVVHAWLLGVLALVVLATALNVVKILQYSHSDTQLATQAASDEARAAELRARAARLRASVDPKAIEFASAEAHDANELIDRRTFSWTELLNRFETTLPADVRITAVRPKIDRGQFVITISVVARNADEVAMFMNNLEATGAFSQVGAHVEERFDEKGDLETSFEAAYKPGAAVHEAPAAPPTSGGAK